MEAARAMLYNQGLPKFLWGEAADIVVYVQNRCPHSALDSKSPEEVFSDKIPDVSHFRVFGCLVYFHMPKEKRSKLDASGKKGRFVGYSETSKAYTIYVPGQREVEICHDVTFDEDVALRKVKDLPISKEDKEEEEEEARRQEERLWAIVKPQRHIESMCLVKEK